MQTYFFTKMHGTGNDFLILNNFDHAIPQTQYAALAKSLCSRHFSLGADGLMILTPPHKDGLCFMHFLNSDGSISEMCGNGARCLCRYLIDTGLADNPDSICFETLSGLVQGSKLDASTYQIRLLPPSIYQDSLSLPVAKKDLTAPFYDNAPISCSYLELGNPGLPHAVIAFSGLTPQALTTHLPLARILRHHPAFPKGANINFYDIRSDGSICLLTYERGVEDFTLSCGSGTLCTAFTLYRKKLLSTNTYRFHMLGGSLEVSIQAEKTNNLQTLSSSLSSQTQQKTAASSIDSATALFLTGSAFFVANGIVSLPS